MSKRIYKGILIPNYKSSYAIESKVEGIKDWHTTCMTMGKETPCTVVTTNPEFGTESALIIFDKNVEPASYDMDLEYIKTVIDDINEAREFDIMDRVATESISIIDETSSEDNKKEFVKSASKYLDRFSMEELTLLDLDISGFIGTEAEEVKVPDPQPAVSVDKPEEVVKSPIVEENEPSPAMVSTPQPDVKVSVSEDGKEVNIVNVTPEDAAVVKEFIDGLKAMNMTVMDFLSTIKSIKAYMSTQAKVSEEVVPEPTPEPVEEPVESTPEPEESVEEEVATEDYTYQDAVPYPTRPGADPQSVNGGVTDIADTENIEAKAGEVLANESVDPYAALDNEIKPEPAPTIAMESAPVEEPKEEEVTIPEEPTPEEPKPEIATESADEPFINTLLRDAHNDDELFELMMEHRDFVPQEILMESININMYEKLTNNVIMNTTMVDRIKRGMRVNN